MTDLPISQTQPVDSAPAFARLTGLFRTSLAALAQAHALNAERKAQRRAPEEMLAAQARREEARRAVDQLWLRR